MNISKIIIELQKLAITNTDTQTALILAKAIEQLKLGTVNVVSSTTQLPTLPLATNGQLYFNETTEDLYYNLGTTWVILPYITTSGIFTWGYNGKGQIGVNTTGGYGLSPTSVLNSGNGWVDVSAAFLRTQNYASTFAIKSDRTLWAWGSNLNGVLGTNEAATVSRSSPVTVVGGITNWSKLSPAGTTVLALTTEGVLYGWGANASGSLGDDTAIPRSSPVTVVGGITSWSSISASHYMSGGIANGIAYMWGNGSGGKLGDNTITNKSSPVTVVGGITDWTQISVGYGHTVGLTASGNIYCWGSNSGGRLGDNTDISSSSPVTVAGGITNWSYISAGRYHTLAVTGSGIAYAWGQNSTNIGRLGDGTIVHRSSPVTVVGGITNWSKVSASYSHSVGITSSGIAYAWGSNISRRLGDGSSTNRSSPVTILGGIKDWTKITAGVNHNIGLRSGPNSV